MPGPEATASRRRADWLLLDKVAHIADRPNGTTAQGFTHAGQAVQVSFWLADPPGLSHLCVHCPGLKKEIDFAEVPTIVCSEKDIAILQIHFSDSPNVNVVHRGKNLYFVYKADREHPSLDSLPVPYPLCFGNDVFGLLPSTDGGGAFHIAALRQRIAKSEYDLYTFSSKTWTWSTHLAQLAPWADGKFLCHKANKVILVDDNTLGFVDLWDGILCCRVNDESLVLRLHHIRLPPPMHINKGMFNCASIIRDVICINGVIKFIEIANRKRPVLSEQSDDLSHNDILHDSDLAKLDNNVGDTEDVYACDGWVAVIWSRHIGSDHWLRDCMVDVNDVTVSNQRHADLLSEHELVCRHSGKSIFNKNVIVCAPTFGLQDGDVVYLMGRLETMDKTACVLAINTREKTLEDLSFTKERHSYIYRNYYPYALSKHMNMAACNDKVSCRFNERDYAKTVPNDTTILVHGLDACVTEAHLMNVFTMFGELSALNIFANQQYASVRYFTRECAEKAMHRMNGNKFGAKNVSICWGSGTPYKQPLQAHTNQFNGAADVSTRSDGYFQMQLKPMKPSNSSSFSVHQNVGGNKKMKLSV